MKLSDLAHRINAANDGTVRAVDQRHDALRRQDRSDLRDDAVMGFFDMRVRQGFLIVSSSAILTQQKWVGGRADRNLRKDGWLS